MSTLFYIVITLCIAYLVYVIASQVKLIHSALKSDEVREECRREVDGFAVVRVRRAA